MLTAVMPIRGRPEHTKRLLRHWSAINAPGPRANGDYRPPPQLGWRLIVVDGGDGSLRNAVETTAGARYIHRPHRGMRHWMETNEAMRAGLEVAETPYAVMVHNDDFVLPAGTQFCIDQLEGRPDHIAWGGAVMAFDLDTSAWPPVHGKFARLKLNYNRLCWAQDFNHESPWDRVSQGMDNQALQFAVYRTEALREVWTRSCEPHFTDGFAHEYFVHTLPLSMGKICMDRRVASYLKQQRASLRFEDPRDWCLHLVREADYRKDLDRLKETVGPRWGEASERFARWLADALRSEYHFGHRLTALKWHLLLKRPRPLMLALRALYVLRGQRGRVYRDLRAGGASGPYCDALRREIDTIEGILRA